MTQSTNVLFDTEMGSFNIMRVSVVSGAVCIVFIDFFSHTRRDLLALEDLVTLDKPTIRSSHCECPLDC